VRREDLVALVDMDGTVADFDGAMTAELAKMHGPSEPRVGTTAGKKLPRHIYARMRAVMNDHNWWANLPRLQDGFDILAELRRLGFYIMVLTQGSKKHPGSWSAKAEWCQRHLPNDDITVMRNKGLVYGRVLVDDYPPYARLWLRNRPRGLVIMPVHAGNIKFSHKRVVKYDGTNIEDVRFALKMVAERASGEDVDYRRPLGR